MHAIDLHARTSADAQACTHCTCSCTESQSSEMSPPRRSFRSVSQYCYFRTCTHIPCKAHIRSHAGWLSVTDMQTPCRRICTSVMFSVMRCIQSVTHGELGALRRCCTRSQERGEHYSSGPHTRRHHLESRAVREPAFVRVHVCCADRGKSMNQNIAIAMIGRLSRLDSQSLALANKVGPAQHDGIRASRYTGLPQGQC